MLWAQFPSPSDLAKPSERVQLPSDEDGLSLSDERGVWPLSKQQISLLSFEMLLLCRPLNCEANQDCAEQPVTDRASLLHGLHGLVLAT